MNCKGPWEGYRRPVVSFPLSFARTFSSRERDVWVWGRQQTWSVTHAGCPMDHKDQLDWSHWLESKEGELLHRRRHEDISSQSDAGAFEMKNSLGWRLFHFEVKRSPLLSFFTLALAITARKEQESYCIGWINSNSRALTYFACSPNP